LRVAVAPVRMVIGLLTRNRYVVRAMDRKLIQTFAFLCALISGMLLAPVTRAAAHFDTRLLDIGISHGHDHGDGLWDQHDSIDHVHDIPHEGRVALVDPPLPAWPSKWSISSTAAPIWHRPLGLELPL